MSDHRIYMIGDIHGQFAMLQDMHKRIARDMEQYPGEAVVVHAGDLVDRGPDSAGVVGWLLSGIRSGKPWVVLKGNHDRMMTLFLGDVPQADPVLRSDLNWLHPRLGGKMTLASYGVDAEEPDILALHRAAQERIPAEHLQFLAGLDTVFTAQGLVCVHAGIRPGVALEDQTEDDLVWIRRDFHDDLRDHGALIVHGHTPIEAVTHYGNRVNIDTGAGFGHPLSAVVFQDGQVWHLTENGRTSLQPPSR